MRSGFVAFLAVLVLLLFAAPAHAVTHSYCTSSLLGGGSLAPDNDISAWWNALENSYGLDIVAAYVAQRSGADGAYQVNQRWAFQRRSGHVEYRWFICYGSGGGYHDINAGF
jgi:hypothetical protein